MDMAHDGDAMTRLYREVTARRRELTKVERAMRTLVQFAKQNPGWESGALAQLETCPKEIPLRIVRECASGFGHDCFTLDQLCERVAKLYPEIDLARAVISRRLYDLRNGPLPAVELVTEKPKRLYRCRGSP